MGAVGEACSKFSPKFKFPEKRLRDVLFVSSTTARERLSHHSQIGLTEAYGCLQSPTHGKEISGALPQHRFN